MELFFCTIARFFHVWVLYIFASLPVDIHKNDFAPVLLAPQNQPRLGSARALI